MEDYDQPLIIKFFSIKSPNIRKASSGVYQEGSMLTNTRSMGPINNDEIVAVERREK